jgi:hypothetical protein
MPRVFVCVWGGGGATQTVPRAPWASPVAARPAHAQHLPLALSDRRRAARARCALTRHVTPPLSCALRVAAARPSRTLARRTHKGYEEVSVPAVQGVPPPGPDELVPIASLERWAQAAFPGYKTLNRIQSRIFSTAYHRCVVRACFCARGFPTTPRCARASATLLPTPLALHTHPPPSCPLVLTAMRTCSCAHPPALARPTSP